MRRRYNGALTVQGVVDFLRFYGPTSIAVLDLAFFEPNQEEILQLLQHMVQQSIVNYRDGRKVNAKRPLPAVSLIGQK